MADFSKEDLLKIAKLSALELSAEEIESFGQQLKKVLAFVDQIKEVNVDSSFQQVVNNNVFRQDEVISTIDFREIIQQAPKQQENYFVVPKILGDKKGDA